MLKRTMLAQSLLIAFSGSAALVFGKFPQKSLLTRLPHGLHNRTSGTDFSLWNSCLPNSETKVRATF